MDQIPKLLFEDPQQALQQLEHLLATTENSNENLPLLELASEVYFELGLAEQALSHLQKAVALDPTGEVSGDYTKFLWLAQLEGGERGIQLYEQGLKGVKSQEEVVQALLGMIEIWMTDLCMEPEAESQCEALVQKAHVIAKENPEVWSILGSIRISQQRNQEAQEALTKSWQIYSSQLENGQLHVSQIMSLLRLCRSLLEVELYDLSLDVSAEIAVLDDQIPDSCYLNALAHLRLYQQYAGNDEARSLKHKKGAFLAVQLLQQMPDVDPEMMADLQTQFADLSTEEAPENLSESSDDEA